MCFKPKRDPRIDEEQKKARAEAEQAKVKAQEEVAAKKAEALEKTKEEQVASTSQVTEGQEYRQSETMAGDAVSKTGEKKTTAPTPQVTEGQEYRQSDLVDANKSAPTSLVDANKSAAAIARSRRKGRSGRRSLITASTSQGYFSRFL